MREKQDRNTGNPSCVQRSWLICFLFSLSRVLCEMYICSRYNVQVATVLSGRNREDCLLHLPEVQGLVCSLRREQGTLASGGNGPLVGIVEPKP